VLLVRGCDGVQNANQQDYSEHSLQAKRHQHHHVRGETAREKVCVRVYGVSENDGGVCFTGSKRMHKRADSFA
jgi:hypothetical protein